MSKYNPLKILDPQSVAMITNDDKIGRIKEGFFGEEIRRRKVNKKKKKPSKKK